ncbi:MAG: hypothetical protein WCB68_04415 [Pyrinomonadaceae bacterium]
MNRTRFTLNLIAAFVLLLAGSSLAHAQATRTWVSGVGDDVNPCSRTAPCKTFAGAISKTAEGGEIDCLDPGGFGTVTITKAITIDGTTGSGFGGITASGVNGVNVNITGGTHIADAVVTLRHLSIQGISQSPSLAGVSGISVTNVNRLNVDECYIANMSTTGIRFSLGANTAQASIKDTIIENTATGISSTSTGGIAIVQVEHCRFSSMADGVNAIANSFITVRDSYFGGLSGANGGAKAGTGTTVNVLNSTFANNNIGVNVVGTLRLSNNEFLNNTTAIAGGTAESANNNKFRGNTADGNTTNVFVVK